MSDFPLGSPEAIVLDGANGVGGAPRRGFPDAGLSSALAIAALAVAVVLLRRSRPAVAVALLLAAVPGAICVLVLRADAPLKRPALAREVSEAIEDVHTAAPWPETAVAVVAEDDDVLFPVGRYAIPARPPPAAGAVRLELRGDGLDVECTTDAGTAVVVCRGDDE
ncbi:MAG: hypothetical protein JNK82_30540 [Myxococcaceae bacterium]|nr:hypothetical protein [Myxococcaceae bacterium]